jgi:asparagine synthase (glutamine-hydrolysing)
MEETLSPERVRATGLFSADTVERVKQDHLARRANLGYHLWGLLTLFLWLKRWNVQTASAC